MTTPPTKRRKLFHDIKANAQVGDMLKQVPLLTSLTDEQRNKLGGALTKRNFRKDEFVFHQGDQPDGFYIILRGVVSILIHDVVEGEESISELCTYNDGAYFGEMALLSKARRNASVQALQPTECLFLEKGIFSAMFEHIQVSWRQRRSKISAEKDISEDIAIQSIPRSSSQNLSMTGQLIEEPIAEVHSRDSKETPTMINTSTLQDEDTFALLTEAFNRCILFSGLESATRAQLIYAMTPLSVCADTEIIKQGDLDGKHVYVVSEGLFNVFVDTTLVTTKSKGDVFGELALMYNAPRTGSVVAAQDSIVFQIDRQTFKQLAKQNGISRASQYVAFLRNVQLLRSLTEVQRIKIAEALEEVTFPANHIIFSKGDPGDCMYIIADGHVQVWPMERKKTLIIGDYFGELALLRTQQDGKHSRAATATTGNSPTRCLKLSQQIVVDLLGSLKDTFQATIDSYEKENATVSETLSPIVQHRTLSSQIPPLPPPSQQNGSITQQDKQATSVSESVADTTGSADLSTDSSALEHQLPLSAITTTTGLCIRTYLTKQTLDNDPNIPVDVHKFLHIGILGEGTFGHVRLVRSPAARSCSSCSSSSSCFSASSSPSPSSSSSLSSSASKTNNASTASQSPAYALKAITKDSVVRGHQQGHIIDEKRALIALKHPFIIRLHATYKTEHRLFLLLEPVLGGELFSLLRQRGSLLENQAQFIAACVVLAIEHIHKNNTIYRDLKPENVLLDSRGYVKLTDFGFAKSGLPEGAKTWTLCGTPIYLAPEIIAQKGHSHAVDWWTLGILLYEMLSGYPPFYDEDPMKGYSKILYAPLCFPSQMSQTATDLITGLLQRKVHRRLGSIHGGAGRIKDHPFFLGIDWDALVACEMTAPIIPTVSSVTDLSHFSEYNTARPEQPAEMNTSDVDVKDDDGNNVGAFFQERTQQSLTGEGTSDSQIRYKHWHRYSEMMSETSHRDESAITSSSSSLSTLHQLPPTEGYLLSSKEIQAWYDYDESWDKCF